MKNLELTEYEQTILDKQIKEKQYFNNGKTTIVILTMNNGFDVTGESSCVHRDMFDMAIGRHYALVDAIRKVEKFIGFGRQQEAYEQSVASQRSWHEEPCLPTDELWKSNEPEVKINVSYEELRDVLGKQGKNMKDSGKLVGGYLKLDDNGISVEDAVVESRNKFATGGIVNTDKLVTMLKDERVVSNADAKEMIKLINEGQPMGGMNATVINLHGTTLSHRNNSATLAETIVKGLKKQGGR